MISLDPEQGLELGTSEFVVNRSAIWAIMFINGPFGADEIRQQISFRSKNCDPNWFKFENINIFTFRMNELNLMKQKDKTG